MFLVNSMKLFLHEVMRYLFVVVMLCGGGEGRGRDGWDNGRWRWSVLLLLNIFL